MDWNGNYNNIVNAIREAKEKGVSILCLPEMCISGYGCEDAFHSPSLCRTAYEVLVDILPETEGMAVAIGMPLMYQSVLFNTACMAVNGEIVGFVAKQFLAGDGLHYEPRWFKPWPKGQQGTVKPPGDDEEYPIGDIHFNIDGVRVGFEICEDAWVAERPGARLARKGVDIILNPSASHFAFGKAKVRRRFVLEGSRAFNASYVYSNLLGNEAGRAIYDGSTMIASSGRMLAEGQRFSYKDFVVTSAVVDVEATRMERARTGSFSPNIGDDSDDCLFAGFDYPKCNPSKGSPDPEEWETGADIKEEEFTRAVSLALFDYMRKARARGFTVSLSGGADSAAVACLVAMMVRFGKAELGPDFARKLDYMNLPGDFRKVTKNLLSTVYQATENSSSTTDDAARMLAEAIDARHFRFDVDDVVSSYTGMVEGALERDMSWDDDDLAMQNIQARARAPGVWMLTNVLGSILLSTSNRSEAAVGYATMDGDTCGGISPIAGIDKAFLRQWLRWMEESGPHGEPPIPALTHINVQAPTAELRPLDEQQTDEGDLMPYPLLDAIEKAAIRDKKDPLETYQLMQVEFPQYNADQLGSWIERFFTLWCRNQWKRERYAPSFHLDDENLDPKTWCRFPILSGGFERELEALREFVDADRRRTESALQTVEG
jgi:NAD+ synthase (glutamine-hydrolysing)